MIVVVSFRTFVSKPKEVSEKSDVACEVVNTERGHMAAVQRTRKERRAKIAEGTNVRQTQTTTTSHAKTDTCISGIRSRRSLPTVLSSIRLYVLATIIWKDWIKHMAQWPITVIQHSLSQIATSSSITKYWLFTLEFCDSTSC